LLSPQTSPAHQAGAGKTRALELPEEAVGCGTAQRRSRETPHSGSFYSLDWQNCQKAGCNGWFFQVCEGAPLPTAAFIGKSQI